MRSLTIFLMAALILLSLTGCRKDLESPQNMPSQLPPGTYISPRIGPLSDTSINLPYNWAMLGASITNGSNNNFRSVEWRNISGPSNVTITNRFSLRSPVTGFHEGVYHFEIKVTDYIGETQIDSMKITVNPDMFNNSREEIFNDLVWVWPMGSTATIYSSQLFSPGKSLKVFARTRAGWDLVYPIHMFDEQLPHEYYFELQVGKMVIYTQLVPHWDLSSAIKVQY